MTRPIRFLKALFRHIMGGLKIVPQEVFEKRSSICGKCPLNDGGTCGVCGCKLSIKLKWATEKCPLPEPLWGSHTKEKEMSSINLLEMAGKRLIVCQGCDSHDKENNKCKECGCNLTFKSKDINGKCPLNKWEL